MDRLPHAHRQHLRGPHDSGPDGKRQLRGALNLTVNGPNGSGSVTANTGNLGTCAASPAGTVCSDVLPNNQAVTLTAAPTPGYVTVWANCTTNPTPDTCQVIMSAARSISATFRPTLTLTILNHANSRSVTSNPAGISCTSGNNNCPTPQTAAFAAGTVVTLTSSSTTTVQWSGGGIVGPPEQLQVPLSAPVFITLDFNP